MHDKYILKKEKFNIEVRAKTIFDHYGRAKACIDSNGVGDGILEDWRRHLNLVDYKASSDALKRALVDRWAIRILQGKASLPNLPILIREHERYEARRAKAEGSTVVRYDAPSGMTDDMVMSCCLANWLLPRTQLPGEGVPDQAEERQAGLWEQL